MNAVIQVTCSSLPWFTVLTFLTSLHDVSLKGTMERKVLFPSDEEKDNWKEDKFLWILYV